MTKQEQIEMARAWHQQQKMNSGCGTPLYAFIIVAIVMLISSCATKTKIEYVDRIVEHYNTITVHDTTKIEVKDSTFHFIRVINDTVYDTKYVEKTRWRDRIVERHDTCWRDSVKTEYRETAKEVVKYPKAYWPAVGISILFFIFAFVKLLRWLRIL